MKHEIDPELYLVVKIEAEYPSLVWGKFVAEENSL